MQDKIRKLKDSLKQIEEKGIDLSRHDTAKSFYDFKERKNSYYKSSFEGSFNDLRKMVSDISTECKGQDAVLEVMMTWKQIENARSEPNRMRDLLDELSEKVSKLSMPKKTKQTMSLSAPKVPAEIKSDIMADLNEIGRCFDAGLYRSATILCGRVLETALHRKYFEATGVDILEKSPGIGLGNLIAKLRDRNVNLDPALTQQIHLINNVRIFSVHKKQEAFMPSQGQANAIILYTIDVLGKMWE